MVEGGEQKMKRGRAADAVKAARQATGMTQQQLSFEIYESREAVSQQENGRYRVQPYPFSPIFVRFSESSTNRAFPVLKMP